MKSIFTAPTLVYDDLKASIEKHPWRHGSSEQSIDLGKRQAGPDRRDPNYFTSETMGRPSPEHTRKAHMTRNQRHLL